MFALSGKIKTAVNNYLQYSDGTIARMVSYSLLNLQVRRKLHSKCRTNIWIQDVIAFSSLSISSVVNLVNTRDVTMGRTRIYTEICGRGEIERKSIIQFSSVSTSTNSTQAIVSSFRVRLSCRERASGASCSRSLKRTLNAHQSNGARETTSPKASKARRLPRVQ